MGAPSPEIQQFIHKEIIQDESEWTVYIQEALLHPSQGDIDELVEFVDRVLKEGFSV
jgi:hypothetical protein